MKLSIKKHFQFLLEEKWELREMSDMHFVLCCVSGEWNVEELLNLSYQSRHPLRTILPPVPNFLSARHRALPHQGCCTCFPSSPIPSSAHLSVCPPAAVECAAAHILNPLGRTHDAMLQQFNPSHRGEPRNHRARWRSFSAAQRTEGGFCGFNQR